MAIVCNSGTVLDLGYDTGRAGGIGMSIFPYIQPEDVSRTMRSFAILAMILTVFWIGCTKSPEEVRRAKLNGRVDGCVSSITNGCTGDIYESELRKIVDELRCETNTIVRDGLVDRLSGQVLHVNLTLKGCEYGELENRIYRYIQCAGAVGVLLQETKDGGQWLEFFVKSGSKLKQACFSVSWESRRKDETLAEYHRRKSVALNLYNTYEQEVALWRCYKGTGWKSLLSSELRDEFVSRTKSLFDYPKRETLLNSTGR